jgi:hypothetical protein
MKEYNKLVRDNIPEIMVKNGAKPVVRVLTDEEYLKELNKKLNVSLLLPDTKSGENCVVVNPLEVPENYQRVVYLDYPLSILNTTLPVTVNALGVGCKYLDDLSVDRNVFAEIYAYLTNCKGKKFTSSWEFYLHNKPHFDAYNFIFAVNVFIELNFFYVNDGILKMGKFQKQPLINSIIYSKIVSLKG